MAAKALATAFRRCLRRHIDMRHHQDHGHGWTLTVDSTSSTTVIDPSWRGYPQNQFGNWTPDQVGRSKMLEKCLGNKSSTIYWMDVRDDGSFGCPDLGGNGETMVVGIEHEDGFWDILQKERPENIGVRSIFVDDLTSPVLRMLGTTHYYYPAICTNAAQKFSIITHLSNIAIATPECSDQHPGSFPYECPVLDGSMLFIDLLAIHMVRDIETSTIISYHPESTWCRTVREAPSLAHAARRGQCILAKNIRQWYPLYAWDESFELLYTHVSELVSVEFIAKTRNPAMESTSVSERDESKDLMKTESENLLSEIDRLEKRRAMLSDRLKNAMALAFATVNLNDSRQTRKLTEATGQGLGSYETDLVPHDGLPACKLLSGKNGGSLSSVPGGYETLAHYLEVTLSLTMFTIYIVVTLQTQSSFHDRDAPFLRRAVWPVLTFWKIMYKPKEKTLKDMV
ncbi:hypothetical protein F4604DRAFT_1677681 [Suillus subluteus]|nr:hypothetical protein F4604DRAFT_1677681 [Suillus subluteus]